MSIAETIVGSAIGFFFARVIGGWVDTRIRNSNRVIDEYDSDVQEILETTFEVRDKAISYWAKDHSPDDKTVEAALLGRMDYISSTIRDLFSGRADLVEAVETELNRFDEAVTGGNFGTMRRLAEPSRATRIERNTYGLRRAVQRCRRKLPRPLFFG